MSSDLHSSSPPDAIASGSERGRRSLWSTILLVAVLTGGGAWLYLRSSGRPIEHTTQVNVAGLKGIPAAVGCSGRVEPENGIVTVAAAPELGRIPVIAKLFVAEGQTVTRGHAIAILSSLPDLEAAVRQAEARLQIARSRVAQLQSGARAGDVLALQAELGRLELERKAAGQELARKEALAAKDFVPRVQVDAARLKTEEADRLLEAARHRMESLTEVRESDLNLARAEVTAAQADVERARIQQTTATISAPQTGQVVRVVARAGEAVGPDGVVTLADTAHMDVIAEIYETDIARIHSGQKARISAAWLSEPLSGVIRSISPQIESRSLPVEPSAAADQRVYQAQIRMDHPELLAHRIHAKVNVLIEP